MVADDAVVAKGLRKRYGSEEALAGVDLTVPAGTVFGLLGPNGAGKSSLMRIASTVTKPSSGKVLFEGRDVVAKPNALRPVLGYLPQDFGVYPNLNSREFLSYLAAAKGMSARSAKARIEELLELVNLTEAVKRPLGKYSGGMLRRIGIAQALLADPKVIIVDEPTAGLDPEERVRFRNLLSGLAADRVVLLSTHIVSDIESVAADIAVMSHGGLRRRDSPANLLRDIEGSVWEVLVPQRDVLAVQSSHVVSRMVQTVDGVRLRVLASRPPSADATPVAPDLEDAYLGIIHGADSRPAGLSRAVPG